MVQDHALSIAIERVACLERKLIENFHFRSLRLFWIEMLQNMLYPITDYF